LGKTKLEMSTAVLCNDGFCKAARANEGLGAKGRKGWTIFQGRVRDLWGPPSATISKSASQD